MILGGERALTAHKEGETNNAKARGASRALLGTVYA